MILKYASDLAQKMDDGSFFVLHGDGWCWIMQVGNVPQLICPTCVNVSVLVLYLFIMEGQPYLLIGHF